MRLLPLLALVAAPAAAQTTEDRQAWINLTAMGSVKGRLLYFAEVQPRFTEDAGRIGQLLLRGALGWKLSDSVSVYGGYLRFIQPIELAKDRLEDRPFVQLSWTMGKIAGGTFSTRTRLEHRRVLAGRDTGWRVRSMLRYVHPLRDPAKARALVWAEPFVALNDTDWGARGGFDQLRSFVGAEVPLAGRSTAEIGYMNQTINDPAGRRRSNHIASLTVFIRP